MPIKKSIISIDAMGGDNAPIVPVDGIKEFLLHHHDNDVFFNIHGDEKMLKKYCIGIDSSVYKIIHAENVILSDEKPSIAIRKSKNSSMRMAIEKVERGESDACLSGGNTGALMALSKLILKPVADIDRPAICAMMPTKIGRCILLDMGANIEVTKRNLLEFAIMGYAFAQIILGKENPKIALLNIGSEDMKGHSYIRETSEILKNSLLAKNFFGYIEPDKIFLGGIDVIVTDGFTGNVVIKAAEGLGKLMKSLLKEAFSSNLLSMAGYLLSRNSIHNTMQVLDPNNYNGGLFVGLNGISVKSHGGADKYGFSNAISVTLSIVKEKMNDRIKEKLIKLETNKL